MKLPDHTTEEQHYAFEERAGIHQDSHATQEHAERMAYLEIFGIEPSVNEPT